jgi:hypothetical protein
MAEITVYCSNKITSTPFRYPLDQILLMYILARQKGTIVHAAGMEIAGKGLIFPGISGAGKSTLSRQFTGAKNPDLSFLSDDRMIIRKLDGSFRAFGTPWPGEEKIAVNKSIPVSGVFFLSHGSRNRIKDIKRQDVLEKLLRVTSIPWYDKNVMDDILLFCEDLIYHVPCFELHFTPDQEAAKFLEELKAPYLS